MARVDQAKRSGRKPIPPSIGRVRQRAFTLIEIIAVVALLALAASTVVFFVSRSLSTQQIRGAGRDLVAALRYTRGQAIVKREEQALELDVERRVYRAPNKPETELPKDMTMKLLTAAEEQVDETTGRVRFFPDGSSTGGRVSLIAGEREWQVEIAWLTGEVKLREAPQ
ncbi:MAG TPA: GspH/FimT family protein [Candidatus Saccharimonadia bacterium]|nr:GspH/FimT family protein [Candidatus Saccharimonadia bacterium]